MSNTRPATARKQTKRSQSQAADDLEQGLRVTLDGEVYEVRIADVTSTVTRELRLKAGFSFNRLMEFVTTDPDTDVIAAWIWLARRLKGEDVDLEDVTVTYRQLLEDGFDVSLPGAADGREGEDPEA